MLPRIRYLSEDRHMAGIASRSGVHMLVGRVPIIYDGSTTTSTFQVKPVASTVPLMATTGIFQSSSVNWWVAIMQSLADTLTLTFQCMGAGSTL
jgi:hypothetical protein